MTRTGARDILRLFRRKNAQKLLFADVADLAWHALSIRSATGGEDLVTTLCEIVKADFSIISYSERETEKHGMEGLNPIDVLAGDGDFVFFSAYKPIAASRREAQLAFGFDPDLLITKLHGHVRKFDFGPEYVRIAEEHDCDIEGDEDEVWCKYTDDNGEEMTEPGDLNSELIKALGDFRRSNIRKGSLGIKWWNDGIVREVCVPGEVHITDATLIGIRPPHEEWQYAEMSVAMPVIEASC